MTQPLSYSAGVPGPRGRSFRTCVLAFLMLLPVSQASADAPSTGHASVPALDDAIPAWLAVRDWMDSGEVPDTENPGSRLAVEHLSAVGVLLRLDGRVVGRGFDPEGDDRAVRRAFGRAMAQAGGDRTIRDLPEPWRSTPGPRLSLELELAGVRRPLVGGTLAAAARRLRPGLDGVAIVRGDSIALALPGRLLSTGTADGGAGVLIRLLDELGLPPQDLPDLRRLDSVRLERFETLRLGQSTPEGLPSTRSRLGASVSRVDLDDDDDLGRLASSLAARLGRWRPPPDPSNPDVERPWLGDFDPIAGSHEPMEAPLSNRLMALWALSRVQASSPALPRPTEVDEPSLTPLEIDLALLATSAADDAETAQLWLALATDLPPVEAGRSNSGRLARRAASLGSCPADLVPDERFDAAYHDAWAACSSLPDILAAFDWLCLAEGAWWYRHRAPGPRLESLRAVRDSLLARQIEDSASDLDGSIPLRGAVDEASDARCLRLLMGMAALRLVPDLDDIGRTRADRGLAGLVRFLRQLQVSPDEAADLPNGRSAVNGVQSGPADPRQPLIATAVALIAVDLLRESIDSP